MSSATYPTRLDPAFEYTLIRAILDVPSFAAQVIPALQPDFFANEQAASICRLIAAGYAQHSVVPDVNVLRARNDLDPTGTDAHRKLVDDVLRSLGAMSPVPP